MCRNIRPLFNFEPPSSDDEVRAAALQFVRKISGYNTPSVTNKDVFEAAVLDVAVVARQLLGSLQTTSLPKDREVEAAKARERTKGRYVWIA
ncbi:MAG: DUF2277 domain-containing protein [Hyphomicrobiaceae bacterium]|nr:DUF2277 domain-containing protein [Hyphomicrobiaceae bacterium]